MARPVLPRDEGLLASSNLTFSGSTTNSFWPLSVLSLVVATTWPVTLARNMMLLVPRASRPCLKITGKMPVLRSPHFRHIGMRARNHMNRNDFAHATGRFSAGIDGGANGG